MLFLDGVYIADPKKKDNQKFIPVSNHHAEDITKLVHTISLRIARYLTRAGLIECDAENSYLLASMDS